MIFFVFFLSGASALLLENIWFRQIGLLLGNSVWASSIVLASFMGGLALGNALAARWAGGSLRLYALLEAVVAVSAAVLVSFLPGLGAALAPALGTLADRPWLLSAARLGVAFVLLGLPTTAMGMTLPVLAHALRTRGTPFGRALGALYGVNTLGAVVGALAGEASLYGVFGLRGTGLVAAGLNLVAGGLALVLDRRWAGTGTAAPESATPALSTTARRLLAFAFLCGATLLALEVVWSRFLLLIVRGTALNFAIMLAVVLAGLSLGSLAAARPAARPDAPLALWAAVLSLAAGLYVAASYAGFREVVARVGPAAWWAQILTYSSFLTLPVAAISGALFTLAGAALHREVGAAGRATSLLTLANTVGAMTGALVAGFGLLPGAGIEASFFVLALSYGVGAAVAAGVSGVLRVPRTALAAAAVFAACLALFPRGLMGPAYLEPPLRRFAEPDADLRILGMREGLTETIAYLETSVQGEPRSHRLVTNGFSMSGTSILGRRYMKAFVYLPVALHPAPRRALLISFGVGSTAAALADTRELEHIDVVDISKDILEMSDLAFPAPRRHPLKDPRVKTHVEDGRYFLQATSERYDLITAEPPPPNLAGVGSLFSREYFHLVRDRLREGGFITHWLPMHNLLDDHARAITAAFCEAFPDCTLWKGGGMDWILAGSRGAAWPVTEARFAAQWSDPVVAPEMEALGLEVPEQLGALFIADAVTLRGPDTATVPLSDDFPSRLGRVASVPMTPWRVALNDADAARARFLGSAWAARAWPADLRLRTAAYFPHQREYDTDQGPDALRLRHAYDVLQGTTLRTLPFTLLGGNPDNLPIAEARARKGDDTTWLQGQLALRDLSRREYGEAVRRLRLVLSRDPAFSGARDRLILALCLEGRGDEARREAATHGYALPDYLRFLEGRCGLAAPPSAVSPARAASAPTG